MDIEDVRQKRRELEVEILNRLREFEKETGVRVSGVDVDLKFAAEMQDPYGKMVANVSVSVDL